MLDRLLDWYRRWVRMREMRYAYLAAILDGVDAAVGRDTTSASPAPCPGRTDANLQ
jgi:hypothetical protein